VARELTPISGRRAGPFSSLNAQEFATAQASSGLFFQRANEPGVRGAQARRDTRPLYASRSAGAQELLRCRPASRWGWRHRERSCASFWLSLQTHDGDSYNVHPQEVEMDLSVWSAARNSYGMALLMVLLAFLVTLGAWPLTQQTPLLFFFIAVLLSAWYGGLGPGLLATVGGLGVSAIFFFSPRYALAAWSLTTLVRLGIFGLLGVLVSVLNAHSQRATLILRRAKETAEAADRLKSEFLATMSHELRTPLNIILGYTAMLMDGAVGDLPPPQRALLQRIEQNAQSLCELVTMVLDLNRLEAGRLPVDVTAVSVPSLMVDLKAELQGLCEQSGLAWGWRLAEGLPVLQTDAGKLKVILKNLLGNAVKFTPEGRITVTVAACAGGGWNSGSPIRASASHRSPRQSFSSRFAKSTDPVRVPIAGVGWACILSSVSSKYWAGGLR
jgi:signal transduction histidine kinase